MDRIFCRRRTTACTGLRSSASMTSNTPYQTHQTLISVQELAALHASGRPLMVFDCSFDLTQPAAGKAQYLQAHVPGAVFADLDHDLSAKHGVPGAHGSVAASEQAASGGRHPLPNRERFAVWLSSIGFSNDRSEEHTSELQSPCNLVCRLLLEKKNTCTPTPTPSLRDLVPTTTRLTRLPTGPPPYTPLLSGSTHTVPTSLDSSWPSPTSLCPQ